MRYCRIWIGIILIMGLVQPGLADESCWGPGNPGFFENASRQDVRACINQGASLHQRDSEGRTPLHLAISASGNAAVIGELLMAGANIDLVDTDGLRPIHVAAGESKVPAVLAFLITWGGNVEAEVSGTGGRCPWSMSRCVSRPIHLAAARSDSAEYLATLLAANADPDRRDDLGRTAIYHAASNAPDTLSMALLLEAGASVEIDDLEGLTPLHMAVQRTDENLDIVSFLLEAGASPDQGDQNDTTVVLWAARAATSSKVMKLLIDASRKPCTVDKRGRTALDLWDLNSNLGRDDIYWELHDRCRG